MQFHQLSRPIFHGEGLWGRGRACGFCLFFFVFVFLFVFLFFEASVGSCKAVYQYVSEIGLKVSHFLPAVGKGDYHPSILPTSRLRPALLSCLPVSVSSPCLGCCVMENLLAEHEGIVLKRKRGKKPSSSLRAASLGGVLQAEKTPKDKIFCSSS